MKASILLIDDDPAVLGLLGKYFKRNAFVVFQALTGREGLALYEMHRPDVVVLDLRLPDTSGLDILKSLVKSDVPVIMLSGYGDIPTAVEATKEGAEYFLTKPVSLCDLGAHVERILAKAELSTRERDESGTKEQGPLKDLGQSKQMRELAWRVERIALAEPTAVLLLGESGTGKGWLARQIHLLSPRRDRPFVEINCAAITGTLLENELFGHEKGAFTDAKTMKRGLLEIAENGTVFLDEIGALELHLQPRLLNVLEARVFRRIGGTREISLKGHIIAASNIDLRSAVAEGKFRADLFFRLNVATVELPLLRNRSRSDVLQLADRIIAGLHHLSPAGPRKISPEAQDCLVRHSWPGNIRELRNWLEWARIMAGDDEYVQPQHLPGETSLGRDADQLTEQVDTLGEVEHHHIERALNYCKGHRGRAAEMLGISRATLYNKMQRYDLKTVGRQPRTQQARDGEVSHRSNVLTV